MKNEVPEVDEIEIVLQNAMNDLYNGFIGMGRVVSGLCLILRELKGERPRGLA
jgi:hypothetical protein